jgi:eukaryotic-like serine/threonine-protein kinase
MTLAPGTRLGPYEVVAALGAGGMGEVYRANDTKLGREVALKILPATFTSDPERVARFRREAQVLASLNHPHIGAIYGLEEANGTEFLVLELVDGESLDKRIARGKIPVDEALRIARQLAEALEAAHEKGIIHRDLKPGNIALTRDGRVKVLDFGLAKAVETTAGSALDVTASPTITTPAMMTGVGMILGTAAYMSPEQAKGRPAGKQSDIWGFGCVLYEMLTRARPFVADDVTSTMAAILERTPAWTALPAATPSAIRGLLRRCLEKNPHCRLHDIADARIEIEEAMSTPIPVVDERRTGLVAMPLVAMAAFVVGGVLGIAMMLVRGTPPVLAPMARLQVVLTEPMEPSGGVLALSRDGRRVVYSTGSLANDHLVVRDLDEFDAKPLAGSEHAVSATFSPDGEWVAFVADRKLKKVSLSGGAPRSVHEPVDGPGLRWTTEQSILFNPGTATGIWRVSEDGGNAQQLTASGTRDNLHRFPELLPNGKAIIYAAQSGISDDDVVVQVLETHEARVLAKGTAPHYLATGHLTYVAGATLYAVRFDLEKLQMVGAARALVEGVRQTSAGVTLVDVSANGTLVYVPAAAGLQSNELVWVDPDGTERSSGARGKMYAQPRLAPDGKQVITSLRGDAEDLWLYDLARGASSRLTAKGSSSFPVWSPDGKRVALSVGRNDIFVRTLDGSAPEQKVWTGQVPSYPFSWSPDGRALAYVTVDPKTLQDIWILNLADHQVKPFLASPFREGAPVFSPDGRWIAYVSDESGHSEIYVSPFPGPGEKQAVSTNGGSEPVWPRAGKNLFYRSGDAVMAVEVTTSPALSVSKPRLVFKKPYERSMALWPNFDASSDGRQLLMVKGSDAAPAPGYINVVLNWSEELKARVPTK